MRVHELAKELNIESEELLTNLRSLNHDVKSALSGLSMTQMAAARKFYASQKRNPARTQTAVAEPPAPTPAPPPPAPAPVSPEPAAPKPVSAPEPDEEKDDTPEVPARKPGEKTPLVIKPPIVVREFAELLGLKPNQLIAELMGMNIFASINQKLEIKTAQVVAEKHGFVLEQERKKVAPPPEVKPQEVLATPTPDKESDKKLRPPVVCFMGHVDHGKTSLLDRIRNAKVAAGEAGGITQHIGAYSVELTGKAITFLDTPGHEAFTKMRARGANLTDIAVIVIDAVDGIMPQTREAIKHAQAAKVALMIAINKIDLRAANIDRVKTQLQQDGLTPDDWGGDTICCAVSAETGDGIDNLLDMISLQAEMMELKANPSREATGFVIEAQLEAGMGPTASVLVRNGTLKVGDPVVCGPHWGKVKALLDDKGKKVKDVGPSRAVKIMGLSGVPEAGSEFVVVESEKLAKQIHEERQAELREQTLTSGSPKKMSLEDLLQQSSIAEKKELNLIIKADVQGSLEAVHYMIGGIKSDKAAAKIILAGIGNISVNDVLLAKASGALLIGFNVSKDNGVNPAAKREGVEIRLFSIIYELIDELKALLVGMLDPLIRENVHGSALVKQVFDLGKKGKIAGCVVTSGKVTSRSRARVLRKGEVMFAGAVAALKRYQNDANEVRDGQECGIRLDHFTDFAEGDVLEMYDVEKLTQQL